MKNAQYGGGQCLGKIGECLGTRRQVYPYRASPDKDPERSLRSYIDFYKEQIISNRYLPQENTENVDDFYEVRMKAIKERYTKQNEHNKFINLPNDVLALIYEKILKSQIHEEMVISPGNLTQLQTMKILCEKMKDFYTDFYEERVYNGKINLSSYIYQKLIHFFVTLERSTILSFILQQNFWSHVVLNFTPCISKFIREKSGKQLMNHEFYPLSLHIFTVNRKGKVFINYGNNKNMEIMEPSIPPFVEIEVEQDNTDNIQNSVDVIEWIHNYILSAYKFNSNFELSAYDDDMNIIDNIGVYMTFYLDFRNIGNISNFGETRSPRSHERLLDNLKRIISTNIQTPNNEINSTFISEINNNQNIQDESVKQTIYKLLLFDNVSEQEIVNELINAVTFMNRKVLILKTIRNVKGESIQESESIESYLSRIHSIKEDEFKTLVSNRFYVFCVSSSHLDKMLKDYTNKTKPPRDTKPSFTSKLSTLLHLLNVTSYRSDHIDIIYKRTLKYRNIVEKTTTSDMHEYFIDFIIGELQKIQ